MIGKEGRTGKPLKDKRVQFSLNQPPLPCATNASSDGCTDTLGSTSSHVNANSQPVLRELPFSEEMPPNNSRIKKHFFVVLGKTYSYDCESDHEEQGSEISSMETNDNLSNVTPSTSASREDRKDVQQNGPVITITEPCNVLEPEQTTTTPPVSSKEQPQISPSAGLPDTETGMCNESPNLTDIPIQAKNNGLNASENNVENGLPTVSPLPEALTPVKLPNIQEIQILLEEKQSQLRQQLAEVEASNHRPDRLKSWLHTCCELSDIFTIASEKPQDPHYWTRYANYAKPTVFKCIYCGKLCSNKQMFRVHLGLHLPNHRQFQCPLCPVKVKSKIGLSRHMSWHRKVKK